MNILITGGSGFIGSYLSNYLDKLGHNIFVTTRTTNLELQDKIKNATFGIWNVLSESPTFFNATNQIDIIIHTATSNDILSKQTLKGIELSTIGTKNVLEYAFKNNIKKVVFFSTFQVYGIDLEGEITENTPTNPLNDYGLNHYFGEQYMKMYANKYKLQCFIIRPSNVFGPFFLKTINRWTLVPGCFCKEAFETRTLNILSSGLQSRNFVHLENLSQIVIAAILHSKETFSIINAASTINLTMLEVANMVKVEYETIFARKLLLQILGKIPRKSNIFAVSLDLLNSKYKYIEKQESMKNVINDIFYNFKNNIDDPNTAI